MAKRVLILSMSYLPHIGGAEIAVKEITDRLSRWRFDMITARLNRTLAKREKIGNINIYRMGIGHPFWDKYIFLCFGFFKAAFLHWKNKYAIVWSIMAAYSGFAVFLKMLSFKIKLLLTLQEGDAVEDIMQLKRVRLVKPVFKLFFRRADYIQAISRYLRDWARKMKAKCPIKIVPNGVDLSKFKRLIPDLELKTKLGIQDNEKIILTVSRLVKKNGVNDLIEAGKRLDFPFRILIIGDGPERGALEALVQTGDLEKKVIFLGQQDYKDLPRYLGMADVFVRPSLSEGFGNVFVEAMACAVPVIGTPVGGIPDFLEDRRTGLFCKPHNPESVAQKIREILGNGELREAIVKNGRKLVKEKYNWDNIAIRIEKIFKQLVL